MHCVKVRSSDTKNLSLPLEIPCRYQGKEMSHLPGKSDLEPLRMAPEEYRISACPGLARPTA